MIDKVSAIRGLYPDVITICGDNAFDANGDQVTIDESLVATEMARLQAEYDSQQYARDRAAEYPPMADYLDGIVKGDQAQIDAYIAACQAVKAKYPKPE
jgi:hypothetical protein